MFDSKSVYSSIHAHLRPSDPPVCCFSVHNLRHLNAHKWQCTLALKDLYLCTGSMNT